MRSVILIVILAAISGCCKEKECVQNYLSIGAIRFSKFEIDSIRVKRFVPGTTSPVDSLLLIHEKNSFTLPMGKDTTLIFIIEPIDFIKPGFNYQISLPKASRVAHVTEFTEVPGTWKDCPARSQTPCRTDISYKLDGNLTISETAWITK